MDKIMDKKFINYVFSSLQTLEKYLETSKELAQEQKISKAIYNLSQLEEVLKNSDIVTLHAPMTPENKYLIDARRLATMKAGSILINASRGGLVDEVALLQALKDKRLSGAALDTFEDEPYKGPLRDLPQVVLTPHMGSAAEECRSRMEREAADNLITGLRALGVI